jgi:hypothetical protein
MENNSDEFSPFQRKWLWYFWRMVLILLKVFCDLIIIKRNIQPPPLLKLSLSKKMLWYFWRMVLILLKVFCDLNIINS